MLYEGMTIKGVDYIFINGSGWKKLTGKIINKIITIKRNKK